MDEKIEYIYKVINKYLVTNYFKLHFSNIISAFERGHNEKKSEQAKENINKWFFNFIQELRIDEKERERLRIEFITFFIKTKKYYGN